MISKIPNTEVTGLLLNLYDREAGEFENTAGRMVTYDAACVVVVLPLGNAQGRSMKYKIRPEIIAKAKAATDTVHWGCIIKFTGRRKQRYRFGCSGRSVCKYLQMTSGFHCRSRLILQSEATFSKQRRDLHWIT